MCGGRIFKSSSQGHVLLLQQQFAHPVYVVNGAIDSKIPDNRTWGRALEEDPVTKLLLSRDCSQSSSGLHNLKNTSNLWTTHIASRLGKAVYL